MKMADNRWLRRLQQEKKEKTHSEKSEIMFFAIDIRVMIFDDISRDIFWVGGEWFGNND